MSSDTSKSDRAEQVNKLRIFVKQFTIGTFIPRGEWYGAMDRLGLRDSNRQRLSDLRKEGMQMDFDKKKKRFHL